MVGYEAEFCIEKNDDEPCTVVYAKKKRVRSCNDPGNIAEVVTGRNENAHKRTLMPIHAG